MLSKKDEQKIKELRFLFPKKVNVKTYRSKDGGFCAEISSFPGCYTEAETFSELIEMVNDVIRTYFNVSKKYAPFMPTFIPPISVAQKLGEFPKFLKQSFNLTFLNREKTKC